MRINSISIENFRGIQKAETGNIGDTVIIAGQNGSGKSCIFDAIRLLKSVYGGYQHNEWQQFFGEFQIQLHGGPGNLRGLYNQPNKEISITAEFQLRDREKSYIAANARLLLEDTIWRQLLPEAFQYGGYQKALFAAQFRDKQPDVKERIEQKLPTLMRELSDAATVAHVKISVDGDINIKGSELLTVAFTNYRPQDMGIIDFHGAQRHYGRELVQGINLSLDQANQNHSAHSLYNSANKYNNVKSEMASNFIKELLSEKAGSATAGHIPILEAMTELFESFFPDKKFLGPKPTVSGSLSFPVQTASGSEHDLDELSSGEKEILYGYLRIRSSAPRGSIILLDEPELHLNPRLIRGLPQFYRKHLGEALENQLWLVTHSDALIREAVGKPGFSVFHMLPCGSDENNSSQLRPLKATANLDAVLVDLVGDLAAYRPGGKGVIFEGGGDSDFDKTFVGKLFAEEMRGINLISGTNKSKVSALHEVLSKAYSKGDLPTKFYAITDRDADNVPDPQSGLTIFSWDVYHIENYLLHPDALAAVLNSLGLETTYNPSNILELLSGSARRVVPELLIMRMKDFANSKIVRCIDLGFSPATLTVGKELAAASFRSKERITNIVSEQLSEERLVQEEQRIRNEIEQDFTSGAWIKNIPGRSILKQLLTSAGSTINYETFRNLVVSYMTDHSIKPDSMSIVLEKIRRD